MRKLTGLVDKYLVPDYCKVFDLHSRIMAKFSQTDTFKSKYGGELEEERTKMQKMFWSDFVEVYKTLPEKGLTKEEVTKKLEWYMSSDLKTVKLDRMSGTLYCDSAHDDLVKTAMNIYVKCNNLHYTTWHNCCRMEVEIGKFLCGLFNGEEASRGVWCPGGSYSNITAVYAAREHAYKENFIKYPEMIMCFNGHPSLEKGAKIAKLKCIKVPTGPDYRIDVETVLNSINSNTAIVALSAPSYPRGVIDDIETIAKVCVAKNIWLHVDACLGSLIVPFLKENNFDLFSKFDFSVEGVCSISCDTHKYGLGPKGASYLLYRNYNTFKCGTYFTTDWDGGILPSISLEGSKPGYVMAATWAVMMHMGREGYRENSFKLKQKAEWLKNEINLIPQLYVQGACDVIVVAIGCKSTKYTIYNVRDKLNENGWYVREIISPPGFHIAITNNNVHEIENMVTELKHVVKELEELSQKDLIEMGSTAKMYAMKASLSGGIKLSMGIDIAIDCMSRIGTADSSPSNSNSQPLKSIQGKQKEKSSNRDEAKDRSSTSLKEKDSHKKLG